MNAVYLGVVFYERMKNRETGRVHSVFDRVVNILLDKEAVPDSFLSIGNCMIQVSPAMLVTDWSASWHLLNVKVGDRVYLCENHLWIGTIKIDTGRARLWRGMTGDQIAQIQVCCDVVLEKRKRQLAEDLQNRRKHLEPDVLVIEEKLQKLIYGLECWIRDDKDTAFDAAGLIGLGRGLTPSGDDVLCGALYGMYFSGELGRCKSEKLESLRADVKRSLHKTNCISSHFLRYAADAMWGEKEEEFLLAFYSRKSCDYREKAQRILETGASSGADQMTGFLLAL